MLAANSTRKADDNILTSGHCSQRGLVGKGEQRMNEHSRGTQSVCGRETAAVKLSGSIAADSGRLLQFSDK